MSATATTSKRQQIYEALRDVGPDGLSEDDLRGQVGGFYAIHIESLRFEGHGIAAECHRDLGTGRPFTVYRLLDDVWADAS